MEKQELAPALLAWFAQNRRTLPFRSDPTPYHVWVSEIMLQQTRVSAALPYYNRWMESLPTVQDLAACEPERLHKLWEGLGYYSRVRNLQKAAQLICAQYGGCLPNAPKQLQALPGIGPYTAGAIASIGFGVPAPAVDGNVLRVFARLYNDPADITLPATKQSFTGRVMAHQPPDNPGDFNQALMELGALICLPGGEPRCAACPLAALCDARAAATQNDLPVKTAPKAKRVQPVTVALLHSPSGWLLQQRPQTGLLAGLWQPLLWEETLTRDEWAARIAALGLAPGLPQALPAAKHIFTHIRWELGGWQAECAPAPAPKGFVWATAEQLETQYTLPGAFRAYRSRMK